ncbi:hypothetical protein K435DRAFT_801103 [Dendrothele bispora CBS 962.96]|uniref:Uncharacterized protein n=1 Tax=Dendrothele bispora (strain CBS 962.96) TaxID=1314807 RepID=A0A4S8LRM6_DENBC|nr:hypothetical protein K435DRAFT_801103 [Dendrothele bispora CBS 962.96]
MKCFNFFPILFGATIISMQSAFAAPVTKAEVTSSTAISTAPSSTATQQEDIFAFDAWESKDKTSLSDEGADDTELSKRIFAADTWESSEPNSKRHEKRNDLIFAVVAWEPEESGSSTSSDVATATETATATSSDH